MKDPKQPINLPLFTVCVCVCEIEKVCGGVCVCCGVCVECSVCVCSVCKFERACIVRVCILYIKTKIKNCNNHHMREFH